MGEDDKEVDTVMVVKDMEVDTVMVVNDMEVIIVVDVEKDHHLHMTAESVVLQENHTDLVQDHTVVIEIMCSLIKCNTFSMYRQYYFCIIYSPNLFVLAS